MSHKTHLKYNKGSEVAMNKTFDESSLEVFKTMLIEAYGEKIALDIFLELPKNRIVSLRVNPLKSQVNDIEHILKQENISFEKVSWYNDAYVVACNEKDIERLDIYQNGMIYLQSLSSMIPALIMDPQENEDILDMAAAPGGKTTQIAALTHNKARLTVTETHKIRAEKLKFNLDRQGVKNATLLVKDARQLDDFFRFDQILLDAPCSGSGTFVLSEPKSYQSFAKELVNKSVKLQRELLDKAIKLLKPGKTLVYSTCSILPIENEEIIKYVLKKNKVELVPIDNHMYQNIPKLPTRLEGTLLIKPTTQYEGFFVCKLKKKQ